MSEDMLDQRTRQRLEDLQDIVEQDTKLIQNLRSDLAAVTKERDRMREAVKDALVWLGDPHGDRPVMSVDSIRDIANSSAALEGVTEPEIQS